MRRLLMCVLLALAPWAADAERSPIACSNPAQPLGHPACSQPDSRPSPRPVDDSPHARKVCAAFADRIRSSDVKEASVLDALQKQPGGFVRMDLAHHPIGRGAEALQRLSTLLRIPRNSPIWPDPELVTDFFFRHLGAGSPVVAVETADKGTLYCASFAFYELQTGGPARGIEPPEALGGGSSSCFKTRAALGAVGDMPTFAIEDDTNVAVSLQLTARERGAWRPYCHIEVDWQRDIAIDEAFCDGDACPGIERAVLDLAKLFDLSKQPPADWDRTGATVVPDEVRRKFEQAFLLWVADNSRSDPDEARHLSAAAIYHPVDLGGRQATLVQVGTGNDTRWFAIWSPEQSLEFVDLSSNDAMVDASDLPTFGKSASTSFTRFDPMDFITVSIQLGGRDLVVKLGNGYFRGRKSARYVAAVAAPTGVPAVPIAGFALSNNRGAVLSVTSKPPGAEPARP